ELLGPEQGAWLNRLGEEHDNLRQALETAHERGDAIQALAMAAGLWRFWWIRGFWQEGNHRLTKALEAAGVSRASATAAAAARALGTDHALARALHGGAVLARSVGDHDTAHDR